MIAGEAYLTVLEQLGPAPSPDKVARRLSDAEKSTASAMKDTLELSAAQWDLLMPARSIFFFTKLSFCLCMWDCGTSFSDSLKHR